MLRDRAAQGENAWQGTMELGKGDREPEAGRPRRATGRGSAKARPRCSAGDAAAKEERDTFKRRGDRSRGGCCSIATSKNLHHMQNSGGAKTSQETEGEVKVVIAREQARAVQGGDRCAAHNHLPAREGAREGRCGGMAGSSGSGGGKRRPADLKDTRRSCRGAGDGRGR